METTPELTSEGTALVQVLAAVLDRLVGANATIAVADPGQVTKFHALKAPGIGIRQYLERVHKYASCSNECYVLALIYIDRLIQRNNFLLTELNVHRVVITAILLGAKFFDDAYYNNAYYAKVGGVLVSEMNGLEVDFLFRINFSLHVTPKLFQKYRSELVSHAVMAGVTIPQSTAMYTSGPLHHGDATAVAPPQAQPVHYVNQFSPFGSAATSKHPSYITPSPPAPAHPMAYPSDVSGSDSSQSMHHASSVPATTTSGMAEALNSTGGGGHSYPLLQGCSPRFDGAGGMMPGVGTIGSVDADQYVVIDNLVFPLQGGMIHVNHGETASRVQDGRYEGSSAPTNSVTVTPHFVG